MFSPKTITVLLLFSTLTFFYEFEKKLAQTIDLLSIEERITTFHHYVLCDDCGETKTSGNKGGAIVKISVFRAF